MTLERLILLISGSVVLGSLLLGLYHTPVWFWVTGLMGAHLMQAAFTGICPVVMALKAMGVPSKAGFAASRG